MTRQLQVESRTGKVRRTKTDVLYRCATQPAVERRYVGFSLVGQYSIYFIQQQKTKKPIASRENLDLHVDLQAMLIKKGGKITAY